LSERQSQCEEKRPNNQDASKSDATICSLRFGSLFAGIGGFDLGFERAGMTCAWQVEIDDYANRVLEKHWPDVRRWRDVRTFPPEPTDEWKVDVICGGFPCQDISGAGKREGINGQRSGLWSELLRTVCVLRPRIAVIENVSEIVIRGLDTVLSDLAACGYDAEWTTLGASQFGAHHIRQRVFILAYAPSERWVSREIIAGVSDSASEKMQNRTQTCSQWLPSVGARIGRSGRALPRCENLGVVDGIPDRLDRLRGCGNAVVPQVAEWIGRQIVRAVSVT
jgi:DNA (cytosine-5)-methyltransferase 1